LSIIYYFTLLCLVFFMFISKSKYKIEKTSRIEFNEYLRFLILGFFISFVYIGFKVLIMKIENISLPDVDPAVLRSLNVGIVCTIAFDVFAEEFVYRKCLYDFMLVRSIPFSSLSTSLLFSFLHPTGTLYDYLFKVLFSLELNFIYKKTRSLMNTVIVHFLTNVFIGLFLIVNNIFLMNSIFIIFVVFGFLATIIYLNTKINAAENKRSLVVRTKLFRYTIASIVGAFVLFILWVR